ncbi:hypothetical protein FOCC_FOCC016009, partial [Frankliniella occidentalis]
QEEKEREKREEDDKAKKEQEEKERQEKEREERENQDKAKKEKEEKERQERETEKRESEERERQDKAKREQEEKERQEKETEKRKREELEVMESEMQNETQMLRARRASLPLKKRKLFDVPKAPQHVMSPISDVPKAPQHVMSPISGASPEPLEKKAKDLKKLPYPTVRSRHGAKRNSGKESTDSQKADREDSPDPLKKKAKEVKKASCSSVRPRRKARKNKDSSGTLKRKANQRCSTQSSQRKKNKINEEETEKPQNGLAAPKELKRQLEKIAAAESYDDLLNLCQMALKITPDHCSSSSYSESDFFTNCPRCFVPIILKRPKGMGKPRFPTCPCFNEVTKTERRSCPVVHHLLNGFTPIHFESLRTILRLSPEAERKDIMDLLSKRDVMIMKSGVYDGRTVSFNEENLM